MRVVCWLMPPSSCHVFCKNSMLDFGLIWFLTLCCIALADPGGGPGARPPCPQNFFKIMQFSGNFWENPQGKTKTSILSKYWDQPPLKTPLAPPWPKSWIRLHRRFLWSAHHSFAVVFQMPLPTLHTKYTAHQHAGCSDK